MTAVDRWPTVNKDQIRTTADVVTWDDLDYWIAARAAQLRGQLLSRSLGPGGWRDG